MPQPKQNESKQDYLKRCTAQVISEGDDAKKAYAKCNSYWDQAKNQRSALNLNIAPEIMDLKKGQARREFLITAYTGAKVQSWWNDVVIDISGIQTKEKMPILREHARDRVVGFGEAWKEDNFYISGQFSQNTQDAKEVLSLADEGYPWQASISVRPLRVEKLKDDKTIAQVNGQEYKGPMEIWRESKVGEVSFVSLGADDNTSAISMSDEKYKVEIINDEISNQKGGETMDITLEILKENAPDLLAEIEAKAEKTGVDKGILLERERVVGILKIDGDPEVTASCIEDGTDIEKSYKLFHDALKSKMDQTLTDLHTDAPPPVQDTATNTAGEDQNLSLPDRCKQKWEKDSKLREEFMDDFDAYLAAQRAMDRKLVRIISKK